MAWRANKKETGEIVNLLFIQDLRGLLVFSLLLDYG